MTNLLSPKPTIMVADDSEEILQVVGTALSAKGYRVVTATNGMEAVEATLREHPDLILMDLNMPLMDGLAAVEEIRKHNAFSQIPILAITGHDLYGMKDGALEAGCDGYLVKPLELDELDATLSWLLYL